MNENTSDQIPEKVQGSDELTQLVIEARELLRSCPLHRLPESVSHPKWYGKLKAWEQRVSKVLGL
jgi:hypothetical protein